jgi:hypothetical protein
MIVQTYIHDASSAAYGQSKVTKRSKNTVPRRDVQAESEMFSTVNVGATHVDR